MIEGIDNLLKDMDQPGLPELRNLIIEFMDGPHIQGQFIKEEKLLRSRVYRLRFVLDGATRNIIVKRFSPDRAHREQIATQRWLQRTGLNGYGPPLLGIAAERNGQCTWHLYEDLGDLTLDKFITDPERVRAAVDLISRIHTNFAESPLLGECRKSGGDLGAYFFKSNLHDAILSLDNLIIPRDDNSEHRQKLKDNLLKRLNTLMGEEKERIQALGEFGGPETLLHGDLWTTNIFVLPSSDGYQARLIDWDHAGVGPISYDLSTFLLRFPIEEREWILNYYRDSVDTNNWTLPPNQILNSLFDTAECSRLANTIIWLANATLENETDWAFDELKEVDQWFGSLEPIIPPN